MNTKDFIWTDESVKEMIYQKLPVPDHYKCNVQKCLDEYKKSKQQSNVDYEILSFRRVENNAVLTYKPTSDHYSNDKDWSELAVRLEWCLKNEEYKIYAVRRLPDNEVFTVGSKIQTGNGELSEIKSFKILETTMSVEIESGYYRLLSKIDNLTSKKTLFTTEQRDEILYIIKKYLNQISVSDFKAQIKNL